MATLKVTNIKNESFAGDQLYLKTDGKIGIGTTSPLGRIHVHQTDSGTVDGLIITNTSTSNNGLSIGVSSSEEAFFWNGSNTSMNFATNNQERMRIDASGWFMINTSTVGSSKTAKELIVSYNNTGISGGDQGRAGITIRSGQNTSSVSQPGYIYFSDGTSGTNESIGSIKYDHSNDQMQLATNGYNRLIIESDGDIEIGGNLKTNNFSSERNVIINGGMQISQRGSDWTSVAASAYHLDRWYYYTQNSSAQVRIRHSGDGPNNFHQSYRINCTTADTSIASNEEIKVIQKIEGFNVQQFEKGTSTAKKFALSFYIKCNKNGTYIVELYDRDNGRDCSGSYTISDGNWNKHTIEFPADTTGGFDFDHAASLEIQFWLVAGSAVQGGSLNTTWRTSADSGSATGQVNFTDSTSNEWMLAGVQLEPSVCTEFNHKLYGEDLALCQRYYEEAMISAQSYVSGANHVAIPAKYVVTKRAAATLTWTLDSQGNMSGTSPDAVHRNRVDGAFAYQTAGGAGNFYYYYIYKAEAEL